MVTVRITQLPVDTFSYYQWFLLGLHELKKEKKIKLEYDITLIDRISLFWCSSKWVAGTIRRMIYYFGKAPRYNLVGEVENNGIKRTFTVDSKDSPFIYTVKLLRNCDVYFKNQCPKQIEQEGFEIMPSIRVPYMDVEYGNNSGENSIYKRHVTSEVFQMKDKIHPGMIGPRRLAWSCRYRVMRKNYLKYLESQSIPKSKKLMAYFGSTDAVRSSKRAALFDLDWEPDVILFLKQFNSSHPNEKRSIVVDLINKMGSQYDGRLIHELVNNKEVVHRDRIVPLKEFCNFIAQFDYNLNISGFRLSIPNRFIESFISGTAVLTDKLHVKWYKPFEEEVVETVDMGYLSNDDVDWETFKNDINNLPDVDKNKILKAYQEKWSPTAFAKYIINTTLGTEIL